MSKLANAVVSLAIAAFAAPAAAQTYDAFTGFMGSINQFPNNGAANGNFIYGTVSGPNDGAFFTANSNCAVPGSTCLQATALGGNDSLPGVYKGGTSFSTLTVPTDRLLGHPGSDSNQLLVVAFVAPVAGTYRLSAFFNSQDSGPSGITLYRIGVQPVTFLQPFTIQQIGPMNSTLPYSDLRTVTLGASEMIGYGIGNGGNFSNDSTGIRFSATAVPEPATWGLMILGFGAVGFALRRRGRTNVAYA